MKKCLLLTFFLSFICSQLFAQLGFTVAPTEGFAKDWQILVENYVTGRHTDFLKYGTTATVDYTFQLPNTTWQITPAIHGMRTHMFHNGHDFDVYCIGVLGNVNFAPFLETDEEINQKKVVFFIQISPGLSVVRQRYEEVIYEDGHLVGIESVSDKKLAFNMGFNLLLETKLTPLLTLSPIAGIRYFPNLSWEGFSAAVSNDDFKVEYDKTNWRHLIFGVRIGLNLESKD